MGSPSAPARPSLRQRRRRRLRNAVLIGLALAPASCQPQCTPPPPAPAPIRYDVQQVVGGLENPWDLAWAPDGTLLVTERTGDINAVRSGKVTRIGRPADVVNQGEGGMMGLAVDPGFATNRRIYACYLTTRDVRVVRFTVAAGYASLGGATPLVTGIPRSTGRHSGCRVRFGPDRNLWITTGDAAVGTNPQDPRSLGGKVLRVTTDGRAPSGNMAAPFQPQIYAYGFRNPQGITFRPSDGKAFIIEHGPGRDDEITPLAAGGNGGWNPVPGYNEQVPMTDLAKYPRALRPVWTSGNPTIAPSGGTFVTSTKWGNLAGTHIVMAVLKGQELRLVNAGNGGHRTIVTGYGRLRVAVEGPDGNLYVTTDANPGRILRVVPVR
jgi:glucose/arabinose dehydrogenase